MTILESNYFPCISYFMELAKSTSVTIHQFESFKKMSFRNRCIVVGANGLINLTVPVEGGRNNKQLVKDVRISYSENWQQQHWKTILSSYAKSPFFEYYQHDVEQLIKKKNIFLIDKNMEIVNWIVKKFKLQTTVELLINKQPDFTVDYVSYINRWLPSNYFNHNGTAIVYNQMFEEKLGFKENVSLVDLIFCEGTNKNILLND